MENAKLMKTLFYNGRFNADGKRMRAVIDREVSNGQDRYRLWRKCGGPDHAYPQAENDTHLLYLELHGKRILKQRYFGGCSTDAPHQGTGVPRF